MSTDISGSMIDHWNRCNRLYYYHHDLGLQPRELPFPIQVGRAGHTMLEAYYRARVDSADHADAVQRAEGEMAWRRDVLGQSGEATLRGVEMARYYFAATAEDSARWQFLEVEKEVRVDRGSWTFVGTIDLTTMERHTGQQVAWDHRFLWEPYTKAIAKRDLQLPRYVLALQPEQFAPRAVRNMISTKPLAKIAKANHGRTKRIELDYTQRRLEIVNAATERVAQKILAWRALPIETRGVLAERSYITGDKVGSCEQCPFVKLCDAEAWGEDTQALLEFGYQPSDYYVGGVTP